MDKKSRRRLFLNTASLGGLSIGAGVFVFMILLSMVFAPYNALILSVIISVAATGYFLGRYFVRKQGGEIVTYGKALGLLLLMLVLGGVVMGAITYLICNVIAPDIFRDIFEAFKTTVAATEGVTQAEIEMIDQRYLDLQNPIMTIFSSIFLLMFFGAFPALFIATFIRTRNL